MAIDADQWHSHPHLYLRCVEISRIRITQMVFKKFTCVRSCTHAIRYDYIPHHVQLQSHWSVLQDINGEFICVYVHLHPLLRSIRCLALCSTIPKKMSVYSIWKCKTISWYVELRYSLLKETQHVSDICLLVGKRLVILGSHRRSSRQISKVKI